MWRIGDGMTVNSMKDFWIPRVNNFRPPLSLKGVFAPPIREFIMKDKKWDFEKLSQQFIQLDDELMIIY